MLLLLNLAADQVLKVVALGGLLSLAVADFLRAARQPLVHSWFHNVVMPPPSSPLALDSLYVRMTSWSSYLDVASHVALDGLEGGRAQHICGGRISGLVWPSGSRGRTEQGGQRLGGLEEVGRLDGVAIGSVDGDVDKRLLDGVEEGGHCGVVFLEDEGGS